MAKLFWVIARAPTLGHTAPVRGRTAIELFRVGVAIQLAFRVHQSSQVPVREPSDRITSAGREPDDHLETEHFETRPRQSEILGDSSGVV